MNLSPLLLSAVAASFLVGSFDASAHVSVGGDRTLRGGLAIDGGADTVTSQFVTTSSGWAGATDDRWGDSHHTRQFKFTLASFQIVTISVSRNDSTMQTGAPGIFLPAFSLFTTPQFRLSTHDTSAATVAYLRSAFGTDAIGEPFADSNGNGIWDVGEAFTDGNGNGIYDSAGIGGSGKQGAFRALDPWTIYVDSTVVEDRLPMNFDTVVGHAADGTPANYGPASRISGDGNADGRVAATFHLAPGDYYLFVGGANYLVQNTEGATYGPNANALPNYGIDLTVTAVPEPTSALLVGLGLIGLAFIRRPHCHMT